MKYTFWNDPIGLREYRKLRNAHAEQGFIAPAYWRMVIFTLSASILSMNIGVGALYLLIGEPVGIKPTALLVIPLHIISIAQFMLPFYVEKRRRA